MIAVLPLLGSYLLYLFWRPSALINYGELLQPPVQLADTQAPEGLRELKGKWVFVSVDSGRCDDYCRRKLYIMRQVRLTQGKDMERVERAWLIDDEAAPPPALIDGYRGTRIIPAAASPLLPRLAPAGSPRDHLYIIDPLGNVVMRYPRDPDPSAVKKDISRLLRASRVG
jgi:hypothetical protein